MDICLFQCDPALGQEKVKALSQVIERCTADLYVLPEIFSAGLESAHFLFYCFT